MTHTFKTKTGREFSADMNPISGKITVNGVEFFATKNGQQGQCLRCNNPALVQRFLQTIGAGSAKIDNIELTVNDSDYTVFSDFVRGANEKAIAEKNAIIAAAPKYWKIETDGVNADGDYIPTTVSVIRYAVVDGQNIVDVSRKFNKANITVSQAREILSENGISMEWPEYGFPAVEVPESVAKMVIEIADSRAHAKRTADQEKANQEEREVKEKFAEALRTGKPVFLSQTIGESADYDRNEESTTCDVVRYAMPDGSVKTEIFHHY